MTGRTVLSSRWRGRLAAPLLLLCAFSAPSRAVESKITEVTVTTDRAEIVREAGVRLVAGENIVDFTGLPWRLDGKSLRVEARGVPATLGVIELSQVVQEAKRSPEWAEADRQVKALEQKIAAVEAQDQVSQQLKGYLVALRASSAERAARESGEGRVDVESIRQIYGFLHDAFAKLSEERLAREVASRELHEQLTLARARRRAAGDKGEIRSLTASVHLVAPRPGALTLRLKYVVRGVNWEPIYRVVAAENGHQLQLVSEAIVRQKTGEPWKGVRLRLSTSSPASSLKAPRLVAQRLLPLPSMRARGGGDLDADKAMLGGVEGEVMRRSRSMKTAAAPMSPPVDSVREDAQIQAAAYDVTFSVPALVSVPSDGSARQMLLRSDSLKSAFSYRVVPELRSAAYLVAATHAPKAYPLLAGAARMYAGSAYLGKSRVAAHAPGEELLLSFGEDKRIKVERLRLPSKEGEAGFGGKYSVFRRAFRTTVENLSSEKAVFALEERIPVSEDERIKVTLLDETTTGWKKLPQRPGILEWRFELEPGHKRQVEIHFELRVPKGLAISF